MKKRVIFTCWNCSKPYSLLRELQDGPILTVRCPYCSKKAVADLNPYRDKRVEVFSGDKSDNTRTGHKLKLPDAIPTAPP